MPPLNLYARVRFLLRILHTRPRVQRAPGIPCALLLFEGRLDAKLGRRCAARMRTSVRVALFEMWLVMARLVLA